MRPEHRHELKTNELAEWLGNLPQWTKENLITIIVVLVVIAAVAVFYILRSSSKNAVADEQLEFTNLLNQLSGSKTQILRAQTQGSDLSYILLQPASNLRTFAQTINNDQMAALALIKQAEALRMELHYRPGTVSEQDLTAQINQAKAAYADAIERSSSYPPLTAKAKFGLGLCDEELGKFAEAEQIYRDIVADPNFKGTIAAVQAKFRLDTMSDYKQKIVFKPSPPEPPPAELLQGAIQIKPADANQPADANLPVDTNRPADVNPDVQVQNNTSEVPDINAPGK